MQTLLKDYRYVLQNRILPVERLLDSLDKTSNFGVWFTEFLTYYKSINVRSYDFMFKEEATTLPKAQVDTILELRPHLKKSKHPFNNIHFGMYKASIEFLDATYFLSPSNWVGCFQKDKIHGIEFFHDTLYKEEHDPDHKKAVFHFKAKVIIFANEIDHLRKHYNLHKISNGMKNGEDC